MDLTARISALVETTREKLGDEAATRVARSAQWAIRFHEGQTRKSDKAPYVVHPIDVAESCVRWGLIDSGAISAALLHDVIEDAPAEMGAEALLDKEDPEVAEMVRALSKIRNLQTGAGDLPATYRRIIAASARDIRVLLIKTFDVLDNSQTFHVHNDAKAKAKASLGLVYVGVARRLGVIVLADQLINQLLPYLMPVQSKRAGQSLKNLHEAGQPSMVNLEKKLANLINPSLVSELEIVKRELPDFFHLAEKPGTGRLMRVGWPAFRLRLIVPDHPAAWQVLGMIHQEFDPLPRHVRDYMNAPRINGFRALTTRILWEGHPITVQVVREMDRRPNQYGILAKWGVSSPSLEAYRGLLATLGDSDLRMSEVHAHVLPDLLDIYSPRGDRFPFPIGSVVLDFAYRVHTEVGEQCVGALVNGIQRSAEYQLCDGDVVEVITKKGAMPQRAWLDLVKTARARTLIKYALNSRQMSVAGVQNNPDGSFVITDITSREVFWATCCRPIPGESVVGRLAGDGRWLVHASDCEKVKGNRWQSGVLDVSQKGIQALVVTFALNHRSGALVKVLEYLAKHNINGHSVQGKGHSPDKYIVEITMGDVPCNVLRNVIKEIVEIEPVQEVIEYYWLG
ncbi:MAG: bifunctional (p)ppGpp synthetase/guanosine-3',5'-bis(diphosphate) 3'-pyrophosphohydrolase [Magnetococcales bacterium]|nr:bifunctional (p)ppGpp synthetase/guanosine-3',5'-bis(diphosphate) 3'-pyrophosphohydrolase [Magnetococcales bacterium]